MSAKHTLKFELIIFTSFISTYVFDQALEKANSTELNLGPTNSTTSIEISVIDINDNLPMFRSSMYNATVFENVMQVSLAIEGSRIEVTDEDQVQFSLFGFCLGDVLFPTFLFFSSTV